MAVFLKFEGNATFITEIGAGDLLHSLFSTIAVHLESSRWGSRFPVVMGPFYQGTALTGETAAQALQEWRDIRAGLAALPPSTVVWDIEQPNIPPPFSSNAGSHVTSMANYYSTQHGLNLVTDILENLECLAESGGTLQFVSAQSAAHIG